MDLIVTNRIFPIATRTSPLAMAQATLKEVEKIMAGGGARVVR